MGKRSSNLNIIGEVSNHHTKCESRLSRVVGQPLLNNNVGCVVKRKGLDGKVVCGRKRFDAAGQNLFLLRRLNVTVERLRFTFTPYGKREFVPRDQVFPLIVVNCLLLQLKTSSFKPVLYIRIVLDSFYLLIFYSGKFST